MIWQLYKKDILRLRKQPGGFLLLIALPILLASLMAFIFNNDNGSVMPNIKLVIEDRDDSFVSGMLKSAFGQGDLGKMFEVQQVDSGTGRIYIEEDKAAALLIIPPGFADSLFLFSPAELILLKNPSLDFGPKITQEVVTIFAEAVDRLLHVGEEPIRMIQQEIDNKDKMTDQTTAAIAVMINQLLNKTGDLVFDPPISLKTSSISDEQSSTNSSTLIFTILLTGIATMSLYFILNGLAVDFFREREQFTFYRILISPVRPSVFILSKQLYLLTAGGTSLLAVWILAMSLWGVRISFSQIPLFFLILIGTVLSTVSIISLFYSVFKTRGQASAIMPAVVILFALLGGGMIPLQSLPDFFKPMSQFSPIFWAVDGQQKIVVDNSGFAAVFPHLAVLFGLSLIGLLLTYIVSNRRRRL